MSIQGVVFCHGGKSLFQRVIDSPAALREEVGAWLRPAAVVVRDEDLELFRERSELFKDCHKKDERKGLSEYLLGQSGTIPLIDADYTDFGRLKSGIETLLQNAEEAGERGIYVLGVGGE